MSRFDRGKGVGPCPEGAGTGPTGRPPAPGRTVMWWTVLAAALLTSVTALLLAGVPDEAPSDFGSTVTSDHPRKGDRQEAVDSRRPGVPVRLTLPGQAVRVEVVPVGTTSTGDLAVPADAHDVGWYRGGPRPGSGAGAAVLVGHVDSRSGDLGALASLGSVHPGDAVVVRADDGRDARYRITARRSVAKEALPDTVFRTSGKPALVVITCTPPFDPERGGYQRLLLVTAVPAGRE